MSVEVVCECGNIISASDKMIGKRIKCPECQRSLRVADKANDEDSADGKEAPPEKKKSKVLLFVGLGVAAVLSCCCLGGIGSVGLVMYMSPKDKALKGPFPIEEKGTWSFSDRTTELPMAIKPRVRYLGYVVPLKAKTAYVISLKQNGGDSDPYVVVDEPDGKVAAHDDDGGGFPNAKLTYTPPKDGDYRIRAATLKGTGAFTLSIQERRFTLEEKGTWNKTDPIHAVKRSPSKTYKVAFKAGTTYTIDLIGNDKGQDPYLYLMDNAKVVAFDDDSGGFPNARIVHTATKDGEYQIIATTISNSVGPFTLTVQETAK